MFEVFFFVPFLAVVGVWGYILLNAASRNRRILQDDILCANEERAKHAKGTMRIIRFMSPVVILVLVIAIVFLVNAYHPFLQINVVGAALLAGGFFFAYLGWALGMVLRGAEEEPQTKELRKIGNLFMISFMGAGILVMAAGVFACVPKLALLFL